eukprot:1184105-Rhodomonas_salina.1
MTLASAGEGPMISPGVQSPGTNSATCLRRTGLQASGTEVGYGGTRLHALCGTEGGYGGFCVRY